MPAEPERHVEKLLRAYSKRRREDASRIPELHPATRQMLRDEAGRTWRPGTTVAEAGEKFGGSLWLRLGIAGAIVAVIVAAVVFMLPEKKGFDLAKAEKTRAIAPASESATVDRIAEARKNTPAPPAAPSASNPAESREMELLRAQNAADSTRRADTSKSVAVTATSAGFSSSISVAVADSGGTAQKDLADWRTQLRLSTPAERKLLASYESSASVSRNRPPESITRPEPLYGIYTELQSAIVQLAETSQNKAVEEMTRQLIAAARVQRAGVDLQKLDQQSLAQPETSQSKAVEDMTQQLIAAARVQRAGGDQQKLDQQSLAKPAAQRARFRQSTVVAEQPQVMNSFAVEQTGRQIRIIEDDGSVYEGQLTGEPASVRFEAAKAEKAPAAEGVMKVKSAAALRDQAAPTAAPATMETVSFVAMGFNRTLGQAVVFRGNLESTPVLGRQAQAQQFEAAAPANQRGGGGAQSNAVLYLGGAFIEGTDMKQQSQTQSGPAVGGIRGKATVGGSVELEIRAVPAQP